MLLDKVGKLPMYFDGAMGTQLIELKIKNTKLTEMLNITDKDIIKKIHISYLEAGSDFITTNTFGANKQKFSKEGQVEEIIKQGVRIAKEACEGYKDKYVMLDIGPSGEILEPIGEATFDEVYEGFKSQVIAGKEAGCDGILFETFTDLYELKAAVLAAKENTDLPVFCTMSYEKNGYTFFGTKLESMIITLEGLGVDALGVNCSYGPHDLRDIVKELSRLSSIPVIVQPNAGLPIVSGENIYYSMTANEFSDIMKEFANMGIAILGGCCGTTPEYIKSIVEKTRDIKYVGIMPRDYTSTLVCSNRKVVDFKDIVLVGERINPTGKPELQQALKIKNMDYLNSEATEQVGEGAAILDINVGMVGIDEAKVLEEAISEIQSVVDVPLQIDTGNYEAMERAARIYNGKPIINSVNGTRESLDSVLPIAKKYGACLIGLTLDENGIAKSARDKLDIAKKIVQEAQKLGIEKKDIIIDCLTVTAAAEQESVSQIIEAIKLIKLELGVKTVLGISNISYGLPERSLVNRTFLTMALMNGLDSAIINPADTTIIDTVLAYKMLTGNYTSTKQYIDNYNKKESINQVASSGQTYNLDEKSLTNIKAEVSANYKNDLKLKLQKLIGQGKKEDAKNVAIECIEHMQPIEMIEKVVVPSLDEVGNLYEIGRIFLPELIKASEAAKAVCEIIQKELVINNSDKQVIRDKIILATVQGDIHDIGKNIVKVILENYNFEVIDLGKDVPAEIIIETIRTNDVNIIGLSALLTTSIKSMETTISQIKKEFKRIKIIAGGAVLSQEVCTNIGADFYARNAMDTVRYARNIKLN